MERDAHTFSRRGVFAFLNFWTPERTISDESSSTGIPSDIPPNPKVFFANERTFLSWLQLCLVIGGLAIGLINFGDSIAALISGFLFTAVSIGMMFYALTQYHLRANRLAKKEKGLVFEDVRGTWAMVSIVLLAVAANFIVHFVYDAELL